MCIVSKEAKLSKTRIMSMALDNGRHLLSYSNKVENTSGQPNSMILAIPGKVSREWFYDTSKYNKFLEDIENKAYLSYENSQGIYSRGISKGKLATKGFDRFKVGMYDILITDNIDNIYDFTEGEEHVNENDLLKPEFRPEISEELLSFFRTHYAGWHFVICVFSGTEVMESQPIMFEYEPNHPDWLYFPTMDSHTGGAPKLGELVEIDHTLIYEYPGLRKPVVRNMKFSQDVPELLKRRNYVSTKWGEDYRQKLPNGDMYIHVPSLEKLADDRKFCYEGFNRTPVHPGKTVTAV